MNYNVFNVYIKWAISHRIYKSINFILYWCIWLLSLHCFFYMFQNAVKKHSEKHHQARHNNHLLNHQSEEHPASRGTKPAKHSLHNSSGGGGDALQVCLKPAAPQQPPGSPARVNHVHHMHHPGHILNNHHSNGLHSSLHATPTNGIQVSSIIIN